jgi:hypothetical protein
MTRHAPKAADPSVDEGTPEKPARSKTEASKAVVTQVRTRVAQVVWVVCVVAALFLALGALCVALKANPENALVKFVLETADKLDFGVFSRGKNGVYHFPGNTDTAHTKNALVNWGLAALVWLVGGRIVSKIIAP